MESEASQIASNWPERSERDRYPQLLGGQLAESPGASLQRLGGSNSKIARLEPQGSELCSVPDYPRKRRPVSSPSVCWRYQHRRNRSRCKGRIPCRRLFSCVWLAVAFACVLVLRRIFRCVGISRLGLVRQRR